MRSSAYLIPIPELFVSFAFFVARPIYYLLKLLFLNLPHYNRLDSDPGPLSGLFSFLPTTSRAFVFIARTPQRFLPSSTRVELHDNNVSPVSSFPRYVKLILPVLLLVVCVLCFVQADPEKRLLRQLLRAGEREDRLAVRS